MEKSASKKIRVMDIVRKKPMREEVNPLLGKSQREQFMSEQKKETLHKEARQEATQQHAHEAAGSEAQPVAIHIEEKSAVGEVTQEAVPEPVSLGMDHPIAYIPKEKPSKQEKKILERIGRRERAGGKTRERSVWRTVVVWGSACVALGMATYVVAAVLPRAEVVLTAKKTDWEYANMIGGGTNIAEVDPIGRRIPIAAFVEKKTNVFQFPATGAAKNIERKASGRVSIVNAFGESSQPLVAGTRLETPDGKIFRLKERVVVPGATRVGGTLTPASIETDVIADKAGESYNIGPVSKFTIPGFAGTSKFEGFYATSKAAMAGGFIGESKYPTTNDIRTAKESAERQMKGVIESFLVTQTVPEGFKAIESSRKFAVTKNTVNENVDDRGNFSVYIEVEGSVDALKEAHVLELMTELVRQAKGDDALQIKDHTLSYGDIAVDGKTGSVSLSIRFKGVFWKPVDLDDFKKNIMGKTQDELKAIIFSSNSLEKADVSLWPFWVRAVPNDSDRVKVELK